MRCEGRRPGYDEYLLSFESDVIPRAREYGCQATDHRLGVPGEDSLEGVLSTREFVAWYNGHPEFGWVGSIVRRCL